MSKQDILRNPWMDFASYGITDASRFKGREEEIKKFLRIIDSGTMSVLYANSGIGKTSFLNAGISPKYQEKGYYPIHIVFPDEVFTLEDMEPWLLQRITEAFSRQGSNFAEEGLTWETIINKDIAECKDSLWWHLHTKIIKNHNTDKTFYPLIIFDQFEEIFTKSKKYANVEIVNRFFKLAGDLASTSLPIKIEDELERQDNKGNYVEINSEHHYKVIFSLRKEYLSDFDYWTNDINSISELHQNRMFLLPLKRAQAVKVITEQPIEGSDTECYSTLNNVTDKILDLIDPRKKEEIEPFILSALCSKLYNKAISENKQYLEPNDVDANINNIVLEIYEDKVQRIFDNRDHLKRFEDALVDGDGHRNRPKIKELQDINFSELYKQKLENAHLIRIDVFDIDDDDNYIELIHDLLAKAICQKREKDEQRRIAVLEKSKKRLKLVIRILVIVVVCCLLMWFLSRYNRQSEEFNKYHTINIDVLIDTAFAGKPRWEADIFFKQLNNDSLLFMCHLNEDQNRHISFQLPDSIFQYDSISVAIEPTDSLRLCRASTFIIPLRDSVKQIFVEYNRDTKYTVRGRVLYRYHGGPEIPINMAYVTLNGEVTLSDEDGYFQFMFHDYLKTRRGCLTVYKRYFKYMQYELELLQPQSTNIVEVELPLSENIPMDSLFEKKRKAIGGLHKRTAKYVNRNTETTDEDRAWMQEIVDLDTVKKDLRIHSSNTVTRLFSELYFVSCENKKTSRIRPIYGWFKQKGPVTPLLFYGTMSLLNNDNPINKSELWRLRITSFEKKTFHTTEHSFIIENPRSSNSRVKEIEY